MKGGGEDRDWDRGGEIDEGLFMEAGAKSGGKIMLMICGAVVSI